MPVVLKPAQAKLTAIIEPSDKVFVALCPELDLAPKRTPRRPRSTI